ncbi:hypothetical protein ACKKBG_A30470 [Auxenochlorella protothecoides x Auxenochlorella symbiontica]
MYRRDFAIVVLSASALYFSLQREGSFHFQKAWYHTFEDASDLFAAAPYPSPKPLAVDLNGDGKPEVLVAAPNGQVQLLAPARPGDGFARVRVLSAAEVEPDNNMPLLALATGYLTPEPKELVRAPRKQVVVLLTSSLTLHCLDHNLRPLWSQRLAPSFPARATHGEVALHVSHHSVSKGDRGLVVLGAGVTHAAAAGRKLRDGALEEVLLGEGLERINRGFGKDGAASSEDGSKDVLHNLSAAPRQFNYFAFEGGKGELRWKHEASDFKRDLGALQDGLSDRFSFHVTAEQAAAREYGEESCRAFRTSVLEALPHSWQGSWDTALHLAHFQRQKRGKGEQKADLARLAREDGGAGSSPAQRTGLKLGGSPPNALAGLLRGRKAGEEVSPNVLVAHLREGIEVVHLFSGRVVCRLHLPSPGLHIDVNGDGVPDHIVARGGDPLEDVDEDESSAGHTHLGPCSAVARTGIPARAPLFNATICDAVPHARLARASQGRVEVAQPMALPLPGPDGEYPEPIRQRHMTVYLHSQGEVTALDAEGDLLWKETVDATWTGIGPFDPEEDEGEVPTLRPLPLHTHGLPTAILAAGTLHGYVLDMDGRVLASMVLPSVPAQPLLVADWNFNGLNDIMLLGHHGVFGWAQVRRPGALSFATLVAALIVIMVGVFVSQAREEGPSTKAHRPRGRSTDQAA